MKTLLNIAFACAMTFGKMVNALTSFHSPKFLVVTAIGVFAVAWCVSTSLDAQAQQPKRATLQLLKDDPEDYVGKRVIIPNCTIRSVYQREKKLFDGYVFEMSDESTSILPVLRPGQIAFVAPKNLGAKIVKTGIDYIGKGWQDRVFKETGVIVVKQMPFCNILVSVKKKPTGEFLATFIYIEGKDHMDLAYVLK